MTTLRRTASLRRPRPVNQILNEEEIAEKIHVSACDHFTHILPHPKTFPPTRKICNAIWEVYFDENLPSHQLFNDKLP